MIQEKLIAVVRVRGEEGIRKDIKDTLNMLCLYKKNYCVFIKATPSNVGMINKAKDYVTYGPVEKGLLDEVIKKRSEASLKDQKKTKKFFRLHPPRKGFGRKGIKKPYNVGGGLGDRKEKINDLIRRML